MDIEGSKNTYIQAFAGESETDRQTKKTKPSLFPFLYPSALVLGDLMSEATVVTETMSRQRSLGCWALGPPLLASCRMRKTHFS